MMGRVKGNDMSIATLIINAALILWSTQPAQPEVVPPAQPEAPIPDASAAKSDAARAAEELLSKLESGDEGIDQLRADLSYDRTFDLEGDRQVRIGELFFDRVRIIPGVGGKPEDAKVVRRFAVRFDTLIVGTRQKNETRIHAFDGRFYADKNPDQKRINRREVVAPGETFDPLKLGEGPLPIPMGQKRDEILRRYTAEVVAVEDALSEDSLRTFVKGATQLRLIPKAEYERADPYREIRLWYREEEGKDGKPGRLLPRMAMTKNRNGDSTIVQLINVKTGRDATIDTALMSTDAPEGWDVVSTDFREHAPVAPANTDMPAPTAPAVKPESTAPPEPSPKADPGNAGPSTTPK